MEISSHKARVSFIRGPPPFGGFQFSPTSIMPPWQLLFGGLLGCAENAEPHLRGSGWVCTKLGPTGDDVCAGDPAGAGAAVCQEAAGGPCGEGHVQAHVRSPRDSPAPDPSSRPGSAAHDQSINLSIIYLSSYLCIYLPIHLSI